MTNDERNPNIEIRSPDISMRPSKPQRREKRREKQVPKLTLPSLRLSACFASLRFIGMVMIAASAFAVSNGDLVELKPYPPEINLTSAKTTQRMVVQATYADGLTRDVTAQASYKVVNPKLTRLDHETLFPISDGKTEVRDE